MILIRAHSLIAVFWSTSDTCRMSFSLLLPNIPSAQSCFHLL